MTLSTESTFTENRRTGIGGSDIAALFGLSTWMGPIGVYNSKLGIGDDVEAPEHAQAGNYMEPGIRQQFVDKSGLRVEKPEEMCRHLELSHRICHLDGVAYNGGSDPVGITEFKNVDRSKAKLWGEAGTDDVPKDVGLQCQNNLFVAANFYGVDFKICHVNACFGGNKFVPYRIEPHKGIQNRIAEVVDDMWFNHVLKELPPPIDGSEGAKALLKSMYPVDSGEELLAEAKDLVLVDEFFKSEAAMKEAKATLDLLKNRIIERIAHHSFFSGPGFKFTYKKTKDGQKTDWKGLCAELEFTPEQLAKFTEFKSGYRSLRKKVWEVETN